MPRRVVRHAVIQPLDPSVRLIPLTQGQNAIVDAVDYDWLTQWNWYAWWSKHTKSFYAKGQRRWMHRWLLGLESDDKRQTDHINHHTLDNRRNNLRIVTHSQNAMNQGKRANNSSGFKGIRHHESKWQAKIMVNGKNIHLGTFATPEAAHSAYCEAAKKLCGEFAKLS